MSLHAIDDIGDAIDATKSFLFPFAARTWLKLAIVVFFIGGGGGFNSIQSPGDFGSEDQPAGGPGGTDPQFADSAPTTVDGLVAATPTEVFVVLGIALLLVLTFGFLSNFMEFVFVESLVAREVHVRRYFSENFGNGLRLLAFRLVLNLVSLALVVGFLYGIFVTVFNGNLDNITPGALVALLPLAFVFFVVLWLGRGLLTGFTTVFVVPMMATSDRGLLGSWRRLLSSMTSNVGQYLAYVFFSVVLGIGVGIIGTIFTVIATMLLAVPFVLVGVAAWYALHAAGGGTLALAAIGIIALVAVLALLLVVNLIQVPLQAFLRYYAMLVLGDIDEELDPMPEVRADIRPDGPDEGSPTATEGV